MPTLKLEIVTPEKVAYSDDVDSVVLPAVEGEMGVLPMHIPLLTQIKPGELLAVGCAPMPITVAAAIRSRHPARTTSRSTCPTRWCCAPRTGRVCGWWIF